MRNELLQLINNAPDALLIADKNGKIQYWNRGAELIFGFSSDEAVGSSLDLIIPEKLRAQHWGGYNRVMADGVTRYATKLLSAPGLKKDGSTLSLEFSMLLLRDDTGEITSCGAILRDVSERWDREKLLKDQLAACNAKLDQFAEKS